MELEWISKNDNGDYYVGYKVKVQRGIKGKTKSKVDEVIIVGIPKKDFKNFCLKENLNYEAIMEELQ